MGPQYGRITTWNGGTWWSKCPLGTLHEQDVNFHCELTVKHKTKHQSYPPPIYSTDSWIDTMWHQCSGCWRYGGESPSFTVREIILKMQNIISSHDKCHEKTLSIPAMAFFFQFIITTFSWSYSSFYSQLLIHQLSPFTIGNYFYVSVFLRLTTGYFSSFCLQFLEQSLR